MKKIISMFIIALILLMTSGCGVKREPTLDPTIPSNNSGTTEEATTKEESSSTPLVAVTDEKNYSMHSGGIGKRHQRGVYRVKLSLKSYETEYVIDRYLNYLDGYGYYIEQDKTDQPTDFARIDLKTGEITTWSFQ